MCACVSVHVHNYVVAFVIVYTDVIVHVLVDDVMLYTILGVDDCLCCVDRVLTCTECM